MATRDPNKSTNVRIKSMSMLLRAAAWLSPPLAARGLENVFTATRRFDVPAREEQWLTEAKRLSFRSRGRSLVAWSWGTGPGVLLVHGWEGRGSQMGAFVQPLVDAGYRVVTFDAPGHGSSPGRRSSLVEMADSVADAARHLAPIDAVIAHSAGAAATTVALAKPCAKPSALVYVAPPADLGAFLVTVSRWLGLGDDVAAITRRRLEAKFGIDWDDLRAEDLARRMTTPLLIIHDDEDREIDIENSERLRDAWPGARLVTTTGLGHRRVLRNAAVIRAAVDFVHASDERARSAQASAGVFASASS